MERTKRESLNKSGQQTSVVKKFVMTTLKRPVPKNLGTGSVRFYTHDMDESDRLTMENLYQ